jgi:hypothetical protein
MLSFARRFIFRTSKTLINVKSIDSSTERFKILTMFDYFEDCIEEVLQRAVAFLDMLSTDGFVEKENGPPKGELVGAKFENLNRHQKGSKF